MTIVEMQAENERRLVARLRQLEAVLQEVALGLKQIATVRRVKGAKPVVPLMEMVAAALAGEPQVCRWRWVRFRGWLSDCFEHGYVGPKSATSGLTECPKCGRKLEVTEEAT